VRYEKNINNCVQRERAKALHHRHCILATELYSVYYNTRQKDIIIIIIIIQRRVVLLEAVCAYYYYVYIIYTGLEN